jgi:DNA-binding CsgD family transcriptional regulator
MELTDEERHYLACLAREMTFEEIAVELGMTVNEVQNFGMKFFDRAFEERKKGIQ